MKNKLSELEESYQSSLDRVAQLEDDMMKLKSQEQNEIYKALEEAESLRKSLSDFSSTSLSMVCFFCGFFFFSFDS